MQPGEQHRVDRGPGAIGLPVPQLPSAEPQRPEITGVLPAAGADAERPGPKGLTRLLIAAGQRHLGLAELLIGAGADPGLVPPGGKGKSTAALAAEKGRDEFAQLSGRPARWADRRCRLGRNKRSLVRSHMRPCGSPCELRSATPR